MMSKNRSLRSSNNENISQEEKNNCQCNLDKCKNFNGSQEGQKKSLKGADPDEIRKCINCTR